jgi:single-strand DNA-binding protein
MNETMVTIVGNVISDVQKRHTQDGVAVVNFRMASNERRFDKATGQWVDGDRLYLSVTCWRRLALGVMTSLEKGDPIVARGRLYTRSYEVEGNKRTVTELEAYQLGPDLSRCHVGVQRSRRSALSESGDEVPAARTADVSSGAEAVEPQHADGQPNRAAFSVVRAGAAT